MPITLPARILRYEPSGHCGGGHAGAMIHSTGHRSGLASTPASLRCSAVIRAGAAVSGS